MMKSKKAASMGMWFEIIIFSMLVVSALIVVGSSMNNMYGDNNDLSYGLVTNGTMTSLTELTQTIEESTTSGQASFSNFGIFILSTLPNIILQSLGLMWGFVSGAWISTIVGMMNLGDLTLIVASLFKLLYWLLIAIILIKIITRSPI